MFLPLSNLLKGKQYSFEVETLVHWKIRINGKAAFIKVAVFGLMEPIKGVISNASLLTYWNQLLIIGVFITLYAESKYVQSLV